MNVIGIDPGTNGGIAWITDGKPCVEKMPDTLQDLWELIQDIRAVSSFGHLEMALTAAGIPFTRIRPQVWQKELGCLTKGDKNVTKRKAQELFPSLKVTHATADALLIAKYGTKQH
jgi:hypothetical protein